jgi:hypothetical protein
VDFAAVLADAEDRDFAGCAAPAFALASAAKIALIDPRSPSTGGLSLLFPGDDLTEPMKKLKPIDPASFPPDDNCLYAFSDLDPLRIWGSPKDCSCKTHYLT